VIALSTLQNFTKPRRKFRFRRHFSSTCREAASLETIRPHTFHSLLPLFQRSHLITSSTSTPTASFDHTHAARSPLVQLQLIAKLPQSDQQGRQHSAYCSRTQVLGELHLYEVRRASSRLTSFPSLLFVSIISAPSSNDLSLPRVPI